MTSEVTGFEAGLSGDEQIRIALLQMVRQGGRARTADLYSALEDVLRPCGQTLSQQGRDSLRFFINRAFELYVVELLRTAYPYYAWTHQGRDKRNERGVDFIGRRIGDARDEHRSIGVQVKFHRPGNAPTEREWLKFLAGCFARRLDAAIFITTGRLTSEQRREAQEANVTVIEGRAEVIRLAALHRLAQFELFGDEQDDSTRES